ncbi:glycine zipper 2TM domain-containing protein [Sphingomonas sp. GC_Shp_2]|nr:glycine zipper 2TM domain-containing protein [Sphingomonas sp. GC_Shp_2]
MVPAAAIAQDRYGDRYAGYSGYDQRQGDWQRPGDDRRDWPDSRRYDRQQDAYANRYYEPAPVRYGYRGAPGYYDQRGYAPAYRGPVSYRYRCQGSGTSGTIIGALAGGLLGDGLAGRGDHTLGTILGGGAGALADRAIDRSNSGC